ncbi:MAG: hemolysin family protein [Porphyromonas sp.]|nr:hemolysin family protein [Porphyromonas sp.]
MIYLYIFVTLVFSAFFSGSEIAYVSADRLRLELDRNKGGLISSLLGFLYRRPDHFITTMLLGNNIALVLYGILMAELLEPLLYQWTDNDVLVLIAQSVFGTIIILFTGEFIPKVIFRMNPNVMMQVMALPLIIIYVLLFPFMWVVSLMTGAVLRLAGRRGESHIAKTFSTVDLEHYLEHNQKDDGESEVRFIQNAISFPTLQARDCMRPRNEIVAVDIEDDKSELEEKFVRSGYSKLIVYRENIDEPVGYIHSSEMFRSEDWRSHIVPALFVPESMYASKIMTLLMQKKKSIAIVIDELGGTAGMVTLEDVIEEIFGDIEDEHDHTRIIAKQVEEGVYILSGRLEIDDLNERFDLGIPEEEDFQTVAGYILHHHQSIPTAGEVIIIDRYRFEVLRSSSTRIVLVKLRLL